MGRFTPRGPEPSPQVQRALAPFVGVSALASTLLMALVGLAFLVPLAYAQSRGWTGAALPAWSLALIAVPVLLVVFAANRTGVRRQLRPLAQVASALLERHGGAPRVRGRLRRGWGVSVQVQDVRVVAARGPRARPDLYLVRGEREYRFRDVRDPLPELDEALRSMGLA